MCEGVILQRCKLYVVENVDRYSLLDFTTHKIEVKPILIPDVDTSYYLVIDFDTSHEAFAHWVYESAIYLPIFGRLKQEGRYKNIRILLNGRKRFKTLFLNFFNIPESDVCYSIDSGSNNTCIFPSPISALYVKLKYIRDRVSAINHNNIQYIQIR